MIRKFKFLLKLALMLFVVLLALAAVAVIFPQKILCVDSGSVKADVIVVLGGGSRERPERAAELFKQQVAPRIIISGFGDAEINRHALIDLGVPANAIEVENQSRTTEENARFTIKILRAEKLRRVVIVTSWYHSRRALATFRRFAPEIKFYSRPSYFAFQRADWSRNFAKRIYLEYLKLPGYWIRYDIWPF
ncbi:MAG TPA: YdcF family protein [Verrucomicrobiae bacterium]|nr:YdcF family protein [Verrucomicrobiae bacterium]